MISISVTTSLTADSQSIEDMRDNLADNQHVLYGIARKVRKLHEESDCMTIGNDNETLGASSVTRFDIDADLLASKAYQRTLQYVERVRIRQKEISAASNPNGSNDSGAASQLDVDLNKESLALEHGNIVEDTASGSGIDSPAHYISCAQFMPRFEELENKCPPDELRGSPRKSAATGL